MAAFWVLMRAFLPTSIPFELTVRWPCPFPLRSLWMNIVHYFRHAIKPVQCQFDDVILRKG